MRDFADFVTNLQSKRWALWRWLAQVQCLEPVRLAGNVLLAIIVGLGFGGVLVYTWDLPSDWAMLMPVALMAPTFVLFMKDIKKLLLVTITFDIPLAFDYTIARRYDHLGGPGGFILSLTTMALIAGYAIWLIDRSLSDGESRAYVHRDITLPALLFFFTMLVSTFQAVDVRLSIAQLFLEVQLLIMYFYLINHITSWDDVRLIFTTLAIGLLAEGTLMLLQYFVGFELAGPGVQSVSSQGTISSASVRVAGTFLSANAAAIYLAVSIVITFAGYLTNNWLVNKRLALMAMVPSMIALVLTQSRGGWLSFVLAMMILIVQAVRMHVGIKAIQLFLVVLVIVGVGFAPQIEERLTGDDHDSAESRLWYTELAFNILNDSHYMFTGVGLNNLHSVMRDYLPLEMLELRHWKYLHIIHNKYLIIWTETGLFGFLFFLWLLLAVAITAFRSSVQTKDVYASIAITGMLAALAALCLNMTVQLFTGRQRLQLLWCIFALVAAMSRLIQDKEEAEAPLLPSGKPMEKMRYL